MTKKDIIIGAVAGGALAIGGFIVNKITKSKDIQEIESDDTILIDEVEVVEDELTSEEV